MRYEERLTSRDEEGNVVSMYSRQELMDRLIQYEEADLQRHLIWVTPDIVTTGTESYRGSTIRDWAFNQRNANSYARKLYDTYFGEDAERPPSPNVYYFVLWVSPNMAYDEEGFNSSKVGYYIRRDESKSPRRVPYVNNR